ncbi:uncharacterized protein [Lolium perenne]|uniref:uncharacterized protein n=1 Tax=Lolium perenne TaxID=4522 RepID=UPI003A98FBAC
MLLSFLSATKPFSGSNQPENTAVDNHCMDDPYGIFEPILDCLPTMFLLILINLEVNLHKQHLQQILRNSYIETYQKSIMSYEKKGRVSIVTPDVPEELKRLFTSQEDDDAKYFRENIRYFNSHFSFTSLGVTLDRRVSTAARTGVYTFRVCAGLYHALDNLVPADNGPRHFQLYIYDTDENLIHRTKRSPDLNIEVVRKILGILERNPYAQVFKSLGSAPNLDEYKISLNTDIKLDQRRYNAPTTSQVAAIWVEGSDPQNCFDRSVVVHGKGDRPLYIRAYYGCYDPLSYPLFFPRGETEDDDVIREEQFVNFAPPEDHATDLPPDDDGDNLDEDFGDNEENATQSRKFVSAREYYCFKLQVRKKLFNIILFGGRLFQQWAVDMYIKIETMRLDWYSKPANQKVLRADLYQGLVDTVVAGESRGDRIGKRIVLPRTFPGGDRDMQRRFLDAMAIVQRWEIPDKEKYTVLHELVVKHMLHGPCACSSIKAVKYLFKYIYKGHDKASFACEQDIINDGGIINEIRQYRDARFVSPPDAMYRLYGYKLFGVSPSVLQLQLHLENMHPVAFKACENLEDVVARPTSSKSMLTEYFEMNRKFPAARKWLYREFPEHYRWIAGHKKWRTKK